MIWYWGPCYVLGGSQTVVGGGHFGPKIPISEWFQRDVCGVHSYPSGCHLGLEWLGWINGITWTCSMSRFGDGGPARCSMGPKQSLERVFFSLKSPFLRGVQRHVLGLQCHQSGCNFWLEWFGWINGTWGTYPMSRLGDGGPDGCSMGPK